MSQPNFCRNPGIIPIFSLRISRYITAINDGAIMIGIKIMENRVRLPGNFRSKTNAKRKPSSPSNSVATTAKIIVILRAPEKSGAESTALKLSSPAGVISNSLRSLQESESASSCRHLCTTTSSLRAGRNRRLSSDSSLPRFSLR